MSVRGTQSVAQPCLSSSPARLLSRFDLRIDMDNRTVSTILTLESQTATGRRLQLRAIEMIELNSDKVTSLGLVRTLGESM